MIDHRQNYRLHQQFDVIWTIPEQKIEGEGIISNISISGMLFVTDRLFEPRVGLKMEFKVEQSPNFPTKGGLVRFMKVGESQYQCGVQFLNEETFNKLWIKWMEKNISRLADAVDSRILGHYLDEGQ